MELNMKTHKKNKVKEKQKDFFRSDNLSETGRHSKIKVIQLIHGLSMGGAETLVKDYCLMADEDTEMEVVMTDAPGGNSANEKMLKEAGVKVISIHTRLGWDSLPRVIEKIVRHLTRFYFYPKELKKIIREEQPDCIHAHMSFLHYLSLIADDLEGIRLFYTCHNKPTCIFDGKNRREDKAARKLIKEAGLRLIALHPDMANELNSRFGVSDTVVVKNGINFSRFRNPSVGKMEMRKKLSIPEDAFVIGHVGRFSPQKNHTFLADVFCELAKRMDNAFLLMVGTGETKGDVISKLNSLNLSGKYLCLENRGDIPELMNAMDVFVFPSIYEGLSVVLVEAQVSGLRCVISDTNTEEVLLTKNTIPLSLEKSPGEWCDVIMDDSIHNDRVCGNLNDYDMEKVMEHLGLLYRGQA